MRKNFTLIELLTVVSIIIILMSILFPSLRNARNTANTINCSSREKQFATAAHFYANDYNDYLPHSGQAFNVGGFSWNFLIATYLNVKIPDPYNYQKGIFNCPSQKDGNCGDATMGYFGFYGGYGWNYTYIGWIQTSLTGYLNWVKRTMLKKPSKTIMMGDTTDDKGSSGTGQGGVHFYLYYPPAFPTPDHYASRHSGGGNMAWCDGHVSTHKRNELILNTSWYKRE